MKIKISTPVSPHSHLREGRMRKGLVNRSAQHFSSVMAILNTKDGIMTGEGAMQYAWEAHDELEPGNSLTVIPVMMANESTTRAMIHDAYSRGVRHIKFLPNLKTTNAHYGVKDFAKIDHVLDAVQSHCEAFWSDLMHVHFHPAHPSPLHDNDEEEYMFLPIFEQLHVRFPSVPMTWKHLSDARVISALLDMGKMVGIGVSAHHPFINATTVYGENANGVFKPTAGDETDREALVRLITSGHNRVFSDPDDAPHPESAKSNPIMKCCGADTTEIVTLLHATNFDRAGKLDNPVDWMRFDDFMTHNACRFYGLPTPKDHIWIEKGEHQVPLKTDVNGISVIPFWAGRTLPWRYAEAE